MTKTIEVINERIKLAGGILTKLSDLTRSPRSNENSRVISIEYTIRYNTIQVNQIKDELSKWQFVTNELLINYYGENHRYTKLFEDSIIKHKIGRDYKTELIAETEAGVTALKSIIESIQLLGDSSTYLTLKDNIKHPLVFISHSSLDRLFVEALVELLEGIGLDNNTLFCSSIPGYWIGLGKDISGELRNLFEEHSLFVIFIHSPNFYRSYVSLNEMGAAWALKTKYCSILTPDMEYNAMTALVDNKGIAIKVNTTDAKARLTEMKDSILSFLDKPDISSILWERKRDKFLNTVASYKVGAMSSQISKESSLQLTKENMKEEIKNLFKSSITGDILQCSGKGSRLLRITNSGNLITKNIRIEWLNEDETVHLSKPFETIEYLGPQNTWDYRFYLVHGHPETIHLRYTWDDDIKTDNTFEEHLQLF